METKSIYILTNIFSYAWYFGEAASKTICINKKFKNFASMEDDDSYHNMRSIFKLDPIFNTNFLELFY
jgi:hypothetical protein